MSKCHNKDMFRETCLRLRALYLEQQEPDDQEPTDEQTSEKQPTTPSIEDTDIDSIKTTPSPLYTNNNPPLSQRSITDMMSMSTMNSAMMAHSLADTITVGDYYCGGDRSIQLL